jgi:hypothetical protein
MKAAVTVAALLLAAACRGPAGPAGAPGREGAAGTSGVERIVKRHTIPPGRDSPGGRRTETIRLSCPAEKKVLAAGFEGQQRDLVLRSSLPVSDDTWEFAFESLQGLPSDVTLSVVCAIAR